MAQNKKQSGDYVTTVLRRDALEMKITDSKRFVEDNYYQTKIAIASWMAVWEDIGASPISLEALRSLIRKHGLYRVVEACQQIAESLLEDPQPMASYEPFALRRIASRFSVAGQDEGTINYDDSIHLGICDALDSAAQSDVVRQWDYVSHDPGLFAPVLQALLYLERFTYILPLGYTTQSVNKFVRVNSWLLRMHKTPALSPGETLLIAMREELAIIFKGAKKYIDNSLLSRLADGAFSSGSTRNAKTKIAKVSALTSMFPCYKGLIQYPLGSTGQASTTYHCQGVSLIEVPKSFAKRRIIAPEDATRAYLAQASLTQLRRLLVANGQMIFINEKDQDVNRNAAYEGSIIGDYATIDLSSASDSISRYLFMKCAPQEVRTMYINAMSSIVHLPNGKAEMLHMLLTSGNPLTWLTEAIWFLAAGRVGCRLAGVKRYRREVLAYGDDLIVPTPAYETVCDVLETLGHTVNRRKSYDSKEFRESCGGWYHRGADVTPVFWPRRSYTSSDVDRLSLLSTLQHKCWMTALYRTDDLIRSEMRSQFRGMSTSMPFSAYDDIWDPACTPASDARQRHYAIRPKMPDCKLPKLYEHWLYYTFLEFGPMYQSELDRLLGISTSRTTLLGADSGLLTYEIRRIVD